MTRAPDTGDSARERLATEQIEAARDLITSANEVLATEDRVAELRVQLSSAVDAAKMARVNHKASMLAARACGLETALPIRKDEEDET